VARSFANGAGNPQLREQVVEEMFSIQKRDMIVGKASSHLQTRQQQDCEDSARMSAWKSWH
jgi:hypothetical protein